MLVSTLEGYLQQTWSSSLGLADEHKSLRSESVNGCSDSQETADDWGHACRNVSRDKLGDKPRDTMASIGNTSVMGGQVECDVVSNSEQTHR